MRNDLMDETHGQDAPRTSPRACSADLVKDAKRRMEAASPASWPAFAAPWSAGRSLRWISSTEEPLAQFGRAILDAATIAAALHRGAGHRTSSTGAVRGQLGSEVSR